MNEQDIRNIVRQEIQSANSAGRFSQSITPIHHHSGGNDGANINQNDILAGNSVTGSIEFAQATTYNIGVNFNPTSLDINGNVIGSGGEKFIVVGNAKFGPSLYLQPGTSTSVVPGGTPQTIIQCSTFLGGTVDTGGVLHTVVDQGHIVDVEYPLSTIHARATITSVSNKGIILTVETLAAGWTMNLNWTIS